MNTVTQNQRVIRCPMMICHDIVVQLHALTHISRHNFIHVHILISGKYLYSVTVFMSWPNDDMPSCQVAVLNPDNSLLDVTDYITIVMATPHSSI